MEDIHADAVGFFFILFLETPWLISLPKVHLNHVTIKTTLPVLRIMGQATIAMAYRPFFPLTMWSPYLWWCSAAASPLLRWGPVKPITFNSFNELIATSAILKPVIRTSAMTNVLSLLHIYRFSVSSHGRVLDFIQWTHASLEISQYLKNHSSTLAKRYQASFIPFW